jgi:rubrerythrin
MIRSAILGFEERLTEALATLSPIAPAPTKPKTEPKTKPESKPEVIPRKPDPFNPVKPQVVPKPKLYIDEITFIVRTIRETYEDEVNPSTQEFWSSKEGRSLLQRHPVLSKHGEKLARSAYEFTAEKMRKYNLSVDQLMHIFAQIIQKEAAHKEQLEELAKEIVSKIWGIEKNQLQAELTNQVDQGTEEEEEEEEEEELDEPMQKLVNKRLTLNTMTQGSATHAMFTMHHLVDKAIQKIDPELLELYNKISAGSMHHYWLIDIPAIMANILQMKAGISSVEWAEKQKPIVKTRAICFPVLCQELSKGVMELITSIGYSHHDPETQHKIIKYADKVDFEPWQIQIGPELWRRFLKALPRTGYKLADVIYKLSLQEPDELHEIIELIIDDPQKGSEALAQILHDD